MCGKSGQLKSMLEQSIFELKIDRKELENGIGVELAGGACISGFSSICEEVSEDWLASVNDVKSPVASGEVREDG